VGCPRLHFIRGGIVDSAGLVGPLGVSVVGKGAPRVLRSIA
jgi:hypothetical protein